MCILKIYNEIEIPIKSTWRLAIKFDYFLIVDNATIKIKRHIN